MTEINQKQNTKEIINKIKEETKKFHSIKEFLDFAFSFKFDGFSIEPIQIKSEINDLLEILKQNKPKNVLEIGTANGGTLFLLSKVVDSNAHIFSIDLPDGPFGGETFPTWKNSIYQSFAKENQNIYLLREDSHKKETYDKLKNLIGTKKFDFILIDGDHSFSGVKQDFETYSQLIEEGGIIAFHDIHPGPEEYVGGVPQFWNEVRKKYNYLEIKDEKKFFGYGIGLIFLESKAKIPSKYGKIIQSISDYKDKKIEKVNKEIENQQQKIAEHPLASLFYVYNQRDDLQIKYPEVKSGFYKNLLDWAIKFGVKEYEKFLSQHKNWFIYQLSEIIKKEEKENSTSSQLKTTEADLSKTTEELNSTSSQLNSTSSQLKTTEADLSKTTEELNSTSSQLKTTEADLSKTTEELNSTSSQLKTTEADLSKTTEELNSTSSQLKTTEADLSKTTEELNSTSSQLKTTEADLSKTTGELNSTSSQLKTTEADLSKTIGELNSTSSQLKTTEADLSKTTEELNSTSSQLKTTEADLSKTIGELNSIKLENEEIKTSIGFRSIRKIAGFIDFLSPPNSKRGVFTNKVRMGLQVRGKIGNKALLKKSKEEIFKTNKKNIDPNIVIKKLEDNLVSGLDFDLSAINPESVHAIKFSGWCYHKNFQIKKIYLNLQNNETQISNINLPRWDVYENQKVSNSINSGFWSIVSLSKNKLESNVSLRIVLDNNKQITKFLGKIKKK